MEIRPLSDKVLVAENKKENTTESGIILEGTRGTGEATRATVLAIGPDVTEVKVGDVQRAIIKEENIIAIFE